MLPASAGLDRQCPGPDNLKVAAIVNWYGISDVNELLDGANMRAYAVTWLGSAPDRDQIAKRVSLGVGRMGGLGENSSGDIFIAFSTMPLPAPDSVTHARAVRTLDDDWLNPLYQATVRATEEAIVNAMLAAEDMKGADNLLVPALPAERLVAALRKYGRMP